jgi:hypothetical protein
MKRHGRITSYEIAARRAEELERQKNLRKRLFALARPGGVEFDTLCDMVLASYSPWGHAAGIARASVIALGDFPLSPMSALGQKLT